MRIAPTRIIQSDPPCNRGAKEAANKTSKLRAKLLIRFHDRDTLCRPTPPRSSTAICRARRRLCRTLKSTPSTLRVFVIPLRGTPPLLPQLERPGKRLRRVRQTAHARLGSKDVRRLAPTARSYSKNTALGARYGNAVLVGAETAKRPVTATRDIITHHVDRILYAVQAEEPAR